MFQFFASSRRFGVWLTAAFILCMGAGDVWGGPTKEELEALPDELQEKLAKKVPIQFLEVPLHRAVETLQRQADLTVLLERNAMRSVVDEPISLEAPSMSVAEALDWITRDNEADWEVTRGVVVVSTERAIALRTRKTVTYDIRAFLAFTPNFIGPSLDLDATLSNTSSGGSNASLGANAQAAAQAGTSLFGEEPDFEAQLSRAEKIEELMTVIQETVGTTETWEAFGGDINSIRAIHGSLIVVAPARDHTRIENLLEELHKSMSQQLSIEARFLLVKTATLDAFFKERKGDLMLDAEAAGAFLDRVTRDQAAQQLAITRTVCANEQRVYLSANQQTTYLSDAEPIGETASVDPTLSTAMNGVVVDVQPTIDFTGDIIHLTFRCDLAGATQFNTTPVPVGSGPQAVKLRATGDIAGRSDPDLQDEGDREKNVEPPADLRGTVKTRGKLVAGSPASQSTVALEKPRQDLVRYRASVRIPDGGAVILTGMSSVLNTIGSEDAEVVMILRAKIKGR